jgi:demethylmenaquinone methyltransferase/2-methoxy-6-polyprenyl-1,4-benzoquinol methylase
VGDPLEADVEDLLAEQVAYYQARAPEYDDWWERRGANWDLGPALNASWQRNIDELVASLRTSGVSGRVLELAGGTGNWTGPLRRVADHLTVVDSSGDTLAINREKNGADGIDFVTADLFSWRADRRYDAVAFSFWISHVPEARWAAFWAMVADALAPDGVVWFCDNAHPDHLQTHAPDDLWARGRPNSLPRREGEERQTRILDDGRRFDVVKRFWQPPELVDALADVGFDAQVAHTEWAFVHGTARPVQGSA